MADAAQIEADELDRFIEARTADQLATVEIHLSLAGLFYLAQALDRRYRDRPWGVDRRVRLAIRSRLDPEPFVAMTQSEQLRHIEETDPDDLLGLHNSYLAWLEDGDERPISGLVLARLLERIDEEEHSRYANGELAEQLSPAALLKIREERSTGRVGELLAEPEERRDALIRGLDYYALDELRGQMDAFSHKHGRSGAWRAAHALVSSLLREALI